MTEKLNELFASVFVVEGVERVPRTEQIFLGRESEEPSQTEVKF